MAQKSDRERLGGGGGGESAELWNMDGGGGGGRGATLEKEEPQYIRSSCPV